LKDAQCMQPKTGKASPFSNCSGQPESGRTEDKRSASWFSPSALL
jgi:hypothetical protein